MTCRLQQGVQLYPGMYDMNVYAMFDVCSKVLDAMFGMCSKGWIQCLECAANVRLEEHMLC